jgi:hypothetical protein
VKTNNSQQCSPRVSFYPADKERQALTAIKAYYGMSSNAAAVRRALLEHAKQIKELVKGGEQ